MRKKVKTWTSDEMQKVSCYSLLKLLRLWGGRERLSLKQIFHLLIPISDKLWVATICDALPVGVREQWLTACGIALPSKWDTDQRFDNMLWDCLVDAAKIDHTYALQRATQYCHLCKILGVPHGTPKEELARSGY